MKHPWRYARAASLFVLCMSLTSPAEAQQPAVPSHPFEANTWHTLTCHRDQQWYCSWEMRRGGDSASFRPVDPETDFIKAGSLPGALNIYLNEETKGTYRCKCRMSGEQKAERRKTVYFYSASKWVGLVSRSQTAT